MIIDIIFAIILVIACIKGYQRGLIIAVFSILAFIIGLAAALKLSSAVADYLQGSTSISVKWLPFLSFLLVFIVVILLVRWGGKLIEKSVKLVLLGWLNKAGGIILFVVLYSIIFSIFLFYFEKLHLLQSSTIQSSQTYPYIQKWGAKVIDELGSLIPIFKDMFSRLGKFFEGIPGN